jgi:hypothetical protein
MSMPTPVHFRQSLLDALTADLPAGKPTPTPARSARTPRRIALGIGVAVAAGVIAATLLPTTDDHRLSTSTAAWAVSSRDGNLVDVQMHYIDDNDLPGLQRALRAAGVPAVVRLARSGCVSFDGAAVSKAGKDAFVPRLPTKDGVGFQIRRNAIPRGTTLGVMVDRDLPGVRLALSFGLFTTDNPGCSPDRPTLIRHS